MVTKELKQRLMAKAAKIRRYEERIKQYKKDRMFNIDQKRMYKEFNREVYSGTPPYDHPVNTTTPLIRPPR